MGREDGSLILLTLLGLGAIVFLMMQNTQQQSGQPIAVYNNEETYEIVRDAKGRAKGLTIHRSAQVQ